MTNIYFGTYKLKEENNMFDILMQAYTNGYRHFDCAELYKNQEIAGKFFNTVPRESIFITSKISFRTIPKGEDAIRNSIETTLSQLNISYIDLMLIHAPSKNQQIAWNILTEYKNKGIIHKIGISNYNMLNLIDFINNIDNKQDIYCNQIEFNILLNRKELINYCNEQNIKIIGYGNYYHTNDIIENISTKMNKTFHQICVKFAMMKGIDIIITALEEEHIKSNIILDFNISQDDFNLLDNMHTGISLYKRYL